MELDTFMGRVLATGVLQRGRDPRPLLDLMSEHVTLGTLAGWIDGVGGLPAAELRHLGSMMGSHPLGFRKMVIWVDRETGVRARVHLWPPRDWPLEQIHDHRFHFTSMILCGGYHHEIYRVETDADDRARTELAERTLIAGGQNYFFEAGRFHRTVPVNALTVSLVLRSGAVQDHSSAVDLTTGKLVRYYGVDEELRQALSEVSTILRQVPEGAASGSSH